MSVRCLACFLAPIFLAALLAPGLRAQGRQAERPALDKLNLGRRSLAIEGFDPVSFFPEGGGRPRRGREAWTLEYRGVTYRFESEENRGRFLTTPVRYEPAYGGWCAWAMADGELAPVDPKSFVIQDGELLLFYDGLFADTRKKWRRGDVAKLKLRADAAWREHYGHPDRDLARYALDGTLALGGHDPVSFFAQEPAARMGLEEHSAIYRGVTYRFVSASSRKAFRLDPSRYEPRVGGWDPLALGQGRRVPGDARWFLVSEQRLYVFENEASRKAFQEEAAPAASRAEAAFRGQKL